MKTIIEYTDSIVLIIFSMEIQYFSRNSKTEAGNLEGREVIHSFMETTKTHMDYLEAQRPALLQSE